jgi:hypothetical protein
MDQRKAVLPGPLVGEFRGWRKLWRADIVLLPASNATTALPDWPLRVEMCTAVGGILLGGENISNAHVVLEEGVIEVGGDGKRQIHSGSKTMAFEH